MRGGIAQHYPIYPILCNVMPDNFLFQLFFLLLAYIIGAFPTSVLVARWFGLPDPRTYGSKNAGATNVARSGKKMPALITLLGDAGKGILAVYLAIRFNLSDFYIAAAGGLAVFGHVFSVFLKFKGGRGVATALGVLAAWHLYAAICFALVWLSAFVLTRTSSVASLVAIGGATVTLYFVADASYFWGGVCIATLIIFRHKDNLQRLINKEEKRF